MERERDHYRCLVDVALEVIGAKWKPLIIHHLCRKPHRFRELERKVPFITRKMLIQHLRELERHGVVSREIRPARPVQVEYAITEYGQTLYPVLQALSDWGKLHLEKG
ncbi:winged helix-turn-helix transcriptional regulator [Paenibacillus allorhizosphaerae]|uniref:HTH-type transcriptional activator HxlR n=1 Tax=Paenibacillus allorhizosphaerae TaxID=2849866 RepID=A0ABN7TL70_9BACL|nr:helix-turn-helix domain-containing protein [Paenibacillus allorhizosphaerae]CAG7645003.1 HTH-type transcriptional activator HxlR [Paenibacillus allorhizosphaerae]